MGVQGLPGSSKGSSRQVAATAQPLSEINCQLELPRLT